MIDIRSKCLDMYKAGFEVYDAQNGKYMSPSDIAKREYDETLADLVDGFGIDWRGNLFLTGVNDNIHWIPKKGKYIVQFYDEKYMRW